MKRNETGVRICQDERLGIALPSNYVMDDQNEQKFLMLGFGSVTIAQIEATLLGMKRTGRVIGDLFGGAGEDDENETASMGWNLNP